MNPLEKRLHELRLQKAMLFLIIESAVEVDEVLFTKLGKAEAEIITVKKQIVRETENNIN